MDTAKCELPEWWKLTELDARAPDLARAVFAMNCFWVGQATLGALDGVADARPGFLANHEVVDVRFDQERLSLASLIAAAKRADVADLVWVNSDEDLEIARAMLGERAKPLEEAPRAASRSDDLRALKTSPWSKLDVPRAQAVRLNALFAAGEAPPLKVISPRQRALLKAE